MFAFIMFICIMSFTPGPNTLMAMVSGQKRGFNASLSLIFGMSLGMAIIGFIGAFFANELQHATLFLFGMKIVGSLYLTYLTYHVWISRPDNDEAEMGGLQTGLLLQLSNVKVYLYFITGLGAFALTGFWGTITVKWILMVLIGSLGPVIWTIGGKLLNEIYRNYFKITNLIIALLLLFSAFDLWR